MIYDKRNRSNLNNLADNTRQKAYQWYDWVTAQGIDILVYETIRSVEKQKENVANGASQTMKSYHIVGQALDWVLVDTKGTALWNSYKSDVGLKVANYAKSLGFEWGGDWKSFPDAPHLQYEYKGYGTDTFGKIQENGDELTVSQYTELKKKIESLQAALKGMQYKQTTRNAGKDHAVDWEWLTANGITDGSNPQDDLTREQLATILKRFENYLTKKLKIFIIEENKKKGKIL